MADEHDKPLKKRKLKHSFQRLPGARRRESCYCHGRDNGGHDGHCRCTLGQVSQVALATGGTLDSEAPRLGHAFIHTFIAIAFLCRVLCWARNLHRSGRAAAAAEIEHHKATRFTSGRGIFCPEGRERPEGCERPQIELALLVYVCMAMRIFWCVEQPNGNSRTPPLRSLLAPLQSLPSAYHHGGILRNGANFDLAIRRRAIHQ